MFENLMKELDDLDGTEIQIVAEGQYPVKRKTPVQHVEHYQNDGTEKIKPAKFVEKAARKNRYWRKEVYKAIEAHFSGDTIALKRVGQIVAGDIMAEVERIDTGRLRHSMVPVIKKK